MFYFYNPCNAEVCWVLKKNQQNAGVLWKPSLVKGRAPSWLLQALVRTQNASQQSGRQLHLHLLIQIMTQRDHRHSCASGISDSWAEPLDPSINHCCKTVVLRVILTYNKLNGSVQLSTGFSDFQTLNFLFSSWSAHMYHIFQSGKICFSCSSQPRGRKKGVQCIPKCHAQETLEHIIDL